MRIVVNDIAASKGGAMTVLKDFYQCVRENDTENEWIFLLGDHYLEETENIRVLTFPQIKRSSVKRLLFDFIQGKKVIASLKPDVVFSLQNTVTFGLKVPQILYVHQPLPFQNVKKFSFWKRKECKLAVYQHIIGKAIIHSARKASKVIVQTDWMKEEVGKKCKLSEDKMVKVLPNVPDIAACARKDLFDRRCFFYPTSELIYKNNACVFAACDKLEQRNIEVNVEMTLPEKFSSGKVVCTGKLPYEKVLENYNKGTLIFPSYIETFGYPLAEARAMGTIVLAADCPFSHELLDGYENAYFFNPFRAEELADLMQKVAEGIIVRKEVQADSVEERDSWKDVMEIVLKRRVLFLTNIPSPYRVDFFNEFGKLCDLTVLFEKSGSDERDKNWGKHVFKHFHGVVLSGRSTAADKAFAPSVSKYLKCGVFDRIVVGNAITPTGIWAILHMKLHRIPYYIEGDGAFPIRKGVLRDFIKKQLFKNAEGYFSTADLHDQYYLRHGAVPEKLLRYPFTSLYRADVLPALVSLKDKAAIKEKLNIREPKVIVMVGQMIHRKGIDVLLSAVCSIDKDIGVYIIGGKATEEYLSFVKENGLSNVHFVDFMIKPQLREYYFAADLFVLPTREDIWGLVINEAMSTGLPVITTDKCIAGLELVAEGENGYIVPIEDAETLAEKITAFFADEEQQQKMAQESLKRVSSYTFENMASCHMKALFPERNDI